MTSQPTLRTLAKIAGVHHTTLSRALRNDPRLSLKTRERLCALARTEGYHPDALVARCMSALQRGRKRHKLETLGLLTSSTRMGAGTEPFQAFCRTISQRAEELGYRVDEFWMGEPGMTTARMGKVLRTRGVEGLIIPPNYGGDHGNLSLDLTEMSVIQHCHNLWRPHLNRVEPHNFQNMLIALQELKLRGYQRIGLVMLLGLDRGTGHEWEGAYHYFHAVNPKLIKLAHLIFRCDGFDDEGLLKWVKAVKPDVLVGISPSHADFFRQNGIRVPQELGLVSMSVNEWDVPTAGIDMQAVAVDRAAVDAVVAQIHMQEKGVPAVARHILLEGVWHEGPTVRRIKTGAAKK